MEKRVATVFTGVLLAKKPTRQSVARAYYSLFLRLERRPFCNNNSSLERLLFLFSPLFLLFPPEYRVPRTTLAKGLLEEEVEWDRNFRKGNDRWKYQFISFDEFSSILFTYIYDRYLIYFNISKIVFINRKNNIDICVLIVKSMFHVSNGLFFFYSFWRNFLIISVIIRIVSWTLNDKNFVSLK